MGVTVVSSLVGGQAELVVDGTGFLVRPGSPTEAQEYIAALEKLVGNPDYTRQLGKKSRERVLDGFSSQAALSQLKKEFCIAIKSNPKKPLHDVEPVLREYAALTIDYFRLETDAVTVWKEYQQLIQTHKELIDKINAQPEYIDRPPSPYLIINNNFHEILFDDSKFPCRNPRRRFEGYSRVFPSPSL